MAKNSKLATEPRICVLKYSDETTICANVAGFRKLASQIDRLIKSDPDEKFHFHVLFHLESETCRYEGKTPKNVWFLSEPKDARRKINPPDGAEVVSDELTFQVVTEADLDELALAQDSGVIPKAWLKDEASYLLKCR